MGVSLNGGTPISHPKMIIFSRKTHGCWVLGNTHIEKISFKAFKAMSVGARRTARIQTVCVVAVFHQKGVLKPVFGIWICLNISKHRTSGGMAGYLAHMIQSKRLMRIQHHISWTSTWGVEGNLFRELHGWSKQKFSFLQGACLHSKDPYSAYYKTNTTSEIAKSK